MIFVPDVYTRRARVLPFVITILPIAFSVVGLLADHMSGVAELWNSVGLGVVASGFLMLCAQLGRDLGREKEPALFAKWGGVPTTRALRHRTARNKVTLRRYHDKLRALIPEIDLPGCDNDEFNDPIGADEKYEDCVKYLRTHTKDSTRFRLLFEENCSYGFRRNLWGMRWIGVAGSASGVFWLTLLITVRLNSRGTFVPPFAAGCALLSLVFLLFFLIRATSRWVRIPADAYAERLLETCEELRPETKGTTLHRTHPHHTMSTGQRAHGAKRRRHQ